MADFRQKGHLELRPEALLDSPGTSIYPRLQCWGAALVALVMVCGAGCGFFPVPEPAPAPETEIVLTFDDGPLAADVAPEAREAAGTSVLDPLQQILAVLERRGIRAVFYIAGPGNAKFNSAWTQGTVAIHQSGHVVAYHAFSHDEAFWKDPFASDAVGWDRMEQDYVQLQALADEQLAAVGLARGQVFSPLFREPFGGGVMGWRDGPVIASRLGWVCHGFALDSMDWTVNADVDPAQRDALQALAEGDAELLVLDRLQSGGLTLAARPVVDVLFHVNSLTARHLDEWIDTVVAAFEQAGVANVTIGVPEVYLNTGDPAADMSSVMMMVLRPSLE